MAIEPQTLQAVGNIGELVVKLLTPVITILGGWAMTQLQAWLKAKTHNTTVDGAITILRDLVTTTVQELEQTTVKALRDNDGRLDAKTAAGIKASALQKLRMLYGPEGLKDLARRLGTSEDSTLLLIGSLIEQAVFMLKGTPPPMPPPAIDPPFDQNVFGGMTQEEKDAQAAALRANQGVVPSLTVPEQA